MSQSLKTSLSQSRVVSQADRPGLASKLRRVFYWCWLAPVFAWSSAAANFPWATNLSQLYRAASTDSGSIAAYDLTGTVLDVNTNLGVISLQDGSGDGLLEMPPLGRPLQAGQQIRLRGTNFVTATGEGVSLGKIPAIDNDGLHPESEVWSRFYLTQGLYPIDVRWFNFTLGRALRLDYSGPNFKREPVADSVLFRFANLTSNEASRLVHGLDFRCYEGEFRRLPDFNRLTPQRMGVCSNFDLAVKTREDYVALVYQGFLQIKTSGLYTFYLRSDDGSQLYLQNSAALIDVIGRTNLPPPQRVDSVRGAGGPVWAAAEGTITFLGRVAEGLLLELKTDASSVRVVFRETDLPSPRHLLGSQVLVHGLCLPARDGSGASSGEIDTLVALSKADLQVRESVAENAASAEPLPLLTRGTEIQQLTRADSRRSYHAIIRGVVTWIGPEKNDLVVQDASRGVYATRFDPTQKPPWNQHPPCVGEIYQIEGFTEPGEFSPILTVSNALRIGMGSLPEPKHPTFDELLRGSMDSQYGEIRGYVTAAREGHLTLLMPGGKIDVELRPSPIDDLNALVHAVVRIRGCMFARWDTETLLVTPDHPLWFGNAIICVDVPPPKNPFEASQRHAWELMQFNAWADFFQRVKVFGQVLARGQGMYYCTDDGFGFRCKPGQALTLEPGDTFEAVGFVELGGASPLIHEAIIRKTGKAPLPAAQPFAFGGTNVLHDATRVWVQGTLLEEKGEGAEQVLQMQSGVRTFAARLPRADGVGNRWRIGSTLKLSGLFSGVKARENTGAENLGELIVNSPDDVVLVAQPPWWTLNRLLAIAGVLAVGLVLTFLWITLLRSQVRRRTIELRHEIDQRQKIEQAQAIEQERARIAQDLHDDLGSRTTAISMLAVAGAENNLDQAASKERFGMILDHSRSLVAALDELVWAANPKYDTISALVEYLAGVAEELLTETGVARHIELPANIPERGIPADVRHHVLLAANEALNNAIRHGHPSEVLLQMTIVRDELEILIRDNGCGFDPARAASGDGLANIGWRMAKVGGRHRIESALGQGASVYLTLPL